MPKTKSTWSCASVQASVTRSSANSQVSVPKHTAKGESQNIEQPSKTRGKRKQKLSSNFCLAP
eukprot:7719320-Ditylum_brightwellii.AAC.1